MIRLIGIDVDGTLLDSDGRLPDANREAIEAAVAAGIHVSLVIGRSYPFARPVAEPLPATPQLYLLYDKRDIDVIAPWADWLFNSFEVIHPAFDGSESEVASYHEDNLRSCQGALIVYGAAGEPWLRGKLRELQKSAAFRDTRTPPPTGICLTAPRTAIKERFRTHQAMLIPQWDGFNAAELQPFVNRVTGAEEPSAGDASDHRR